MQYTRNHFLLSPVIFSIFYLLLFGNHSVKNTTTIAESTSLTLRINPPSRSLICKGDRLHLVARTSVAGTSIAWSPNDGSITPLSDSSIIVMPENDTWYFATASDGICTAIDSVLIQVQEVILLTNEVDPRCAGDPFMLAAQANVDGIFTWFPGELIGDTVFVNTKDTTIYRVEFVSACGITSGEVIVRAAENPSIQVFCLNLQTDPILNVGEEVDIFVLPNDTEGAVFEWNDGDIDPTRTVLPLPPETFYSVTVTYPNGCTREAEKGFMVAPSEENAKARMPNAFTPDGDGENDFFTPVILSGNFTIKSFQIFNRWGNLVYDNDTPETGWDGTVDGLPAASEVYLYQAIITSSLGEEEVFRGNVTLIR